MIVVCFQQINTLISFSRTYLLFYTALLFLLSSAEPPKSVVHNSRHSLESASSELLKAFLVQLLLQGIHKHYNRFLMLWIHVWVYLLSHV